MARTTIAIQDRTRARIKAAAASESTTIDSFLSALLDAHERHVFWDSFDDVTPELYAATVAVDGDSVDESYRAEDVALAAAER